MTDAVVQSEATGRRKTAVARVRMKLGSGQFTVNGRPLTEFFPRESLVTAIHQPLDAAGVMGRYDIQASVKGGGISGQAGAVRHGISRAIEQLDPSQRPTLKRQGMLTRDARMKERKKYGQRGARARFQFSKR
ncbi:MAG: 30S ribosomal protein S9 [Myxococcota bacterium]|nr:30S ribosomal protein S9 [Myxococcota bacterium]